eukprot:scaffold49630_cov30-Tisochrysis_lutea.AAC.2
MHRERLKRTITLGQWSRFEFVLDLQMRDSYMENCRRVVLHLVKRVASGVRIPSPIIEQNASAMRGKIKSVKGDRCDGECHPASQPRKPHDNHV